MVHCLPGCGSCRYFGEVKGSDRYAPWCSADRQARLNADLTLMIDLILAGKRGVVGREKLPGANRGWPRAMG
jgi:hypothetical protein